MEENDLWKEDSLNKKSNMTEELFNKIIDTAYEIYEPIAKENNEKLTINNRWKDKTVNANCSRFWGSVTVNMYGGLARRDEVNPEGFMYVLCHELGHAYGGEPYIQAWRKLSAEGQADYYGAMDCAKQVMKKLEFEGYVFEPTEFMQTACDENEFDGTRDECLRSLTAGQSLGNLLASMKKEDAPDYTTPDPTVVKKTLTSYPKTVQCRLDTYYNGSFGLERPACWFKD
jgi:hypothetical protein